MDVTTARRCSHHGCAGTFEMKSPSNTTYRYAKDAPDSWDGCTVRMYKCTDGHMNMIFWEQKKPATSSD